MMWKYIIKFHFWNEPPGTTGYASAHFAKSFVQESSTVKVYLDGNLQNYAATSAEDSWLIYFTYHQSIHTVLINLNSSTPKSSTKTPLETASIIAVAIALIAAIGIALKKRGRKENTHGSGYPKA